MHTLCLQLDACCVLSLFIFFFTECACLLYLDLLFCGQTNDLKDNPYAFTIKLIKNNRYKYCPLENKRLQWSSKLYIPYWLQHAVYMESTRNTNHRLRTHKKEYLRRKSRTLSQLILIDTSAVPRCTNVKKKKNQSFNRSALVYGETTVILIGSFALQNSQSNTINSKTWIIQTKLEEGVSRVIKV